MEKLLFDMQLCGLSIVTQKNYIYHVKKFGEFLNKPIEDSNTEDAMNVGISMFHTIPVEIGTVPNVKPLLRKNG